MKTSGRCVVHSTNSFTVRAGTFCGFTSNAKSELTTWLTGAKSLTGSYGSLV
ncbi:Uncharacterised protein [Mycobacteroides abscessus subsp. abscessus]|nr:Uncharacterised protein [Mycobacteroides abscessus subsp. abscessus]